MRIITGIAKGRKLKAPEGLDTRPTADRVKQSLFNIISSRIIDSDVLDLFAGTGNLGLEALSQGAKACTFIEFNKTTYKVLKENIEALSFKDKAETYSEDAVTVLRMLNKKNKIFDIIFLDPPYSKGLIELSVAEIEKLGLLNKEGIIVSEYDINDTIPDRIGKIVNNRTVRYGRTKVSFWSWEDIK